MRSIFYIKNQRFFKVCKLRFRGYKTFSFDAMKIEKFSQALIFKHQNPNSFEGYEIIFQYLILENYIKL